MTEEERDARLAELGGEEWTLEEAAHHLSELVDEQAAAKLQMHPHPLRGPLFLAGRTGAADGGVGLRS